MLLLHANLTLRFIDNLVGVNVNFLSHPVATFLNISLNIQKSVGYLVYLAIHCTCICMAFDIMLTDSLALELFQI